ncbi:hypothetical protein BDY21DRAFT_342946 [Lineolata rhizophorae]|uniref:Uncharacterized protein n=1 Tax=Lineolata rhizophorae TaxID=578093 RepID=A0A6A6P1G7_9PEZI|nr:hypothetical protein BDY21DRAFT_342946 [Lineolata rhizophorae]
MSAPNQGRQSPPPERQTGAQLNEPTSTQPNEQGAAPSLDHAKEASEDQKSKLPSNPVHPLEKFAEEKSSKQ